MCNFNKGIKFCTCDIDTLKLRNQQLYRKVKGELVPIPNRKNDKIPLMYIWHLFRYKEQQTELFMIGRYLFPTDDIGNGLNAEWVALNLNVEDCFDFDYTPQEGDNLFITQNVEMAPYLSFIFRKGEWTEDHYDPFSVQTELCYQGKLIALHNDENNE